MDDLKMYGANRGQLDSLVQAARIFPEDIQMSLDKRAVLEMKRGKKVNNTGIELQDDQRIGEVEIRGYKYLGILQIDHIF